MPCILNKEMETEWLSGGLSIDALQIPFSENQMNAHEVNKTLMLSSDNNRAETQLPSYNTSFEQGTLF